MSRHILSLADEHLTPFDLEALVSHADALNQRHREAFTTPFPKAPSRWLSHYHAYDPSEEDLVVRFEQRVAGANCIVLQDISQPFHLVQLAQSESVVSFASSVRTEDCE